jgi:PAS domain S-box-containing protein
VTRQWSIRAHLVALVLAVVLPLMALEVYTILQEARKDVERAEEGLLDLARLVGSTVGQFLEDGRSLLEELSSRPEVMAMDPGGCTGLLEDLNTFLPQYTNLFVTDLEAGLVCSGIPPGAVVPDPPAESEWFQGVLATGDFALGKPHRGLLSDLWNVVMAYPVRDGSGEMTGVVALAVDLIRFQDLLATPALTEGMVITIDDLDGVVVARSAESELWVGRSLPPSGLPREVLEGAGGITRAEGAEGEERLWGFVAVPDFPWRVWAGVPTEVLYGPIRVTAIQRGSLAVVLLALVGILSILLYRRIAVSLIRLMWEARQAGRADGRKTLSVRGPKEVMAVAEEFNRTLEARSEAEDRYRRSLARYRSVTTNAAFGIFAVDRSGQLLEANPALADMLGYATPAKLLEVPFPELFGNPHDALLLEPSENGGGRLGPVEVVWVRRDGEPLTVRLSGNRIRTGEGEEIRELIAEDVTAQRVLEARVRQSQKMEAVGRLAGGVAHDFNNLLTVITGSSHLLLSDLEPGDPTREGVEEVLDAANRGASLTRQLLAFSRKQVLQTREVDLNRVVTEMEAFLGRLVGEKVQLGTELDPDLPAVRADPGQMQQVIMNLVLNARDAIEVTGPVTIRTGQVHLRHDPARAPVDLPPGRYVTLAVEDTGVGIPPEIQGRIFEPFFTTKEEGTGLGLATVYGVAVQSGGQVLVESAPDQGSRFTVFLPMAE